MFDRLEKLIGTTNINKLKEKTILIVGLGGVGGYACETLVRNAIGNIIIIDNDKVDITNKNRQIIATNLTIGKYKTDVMEERLLSINENCNVTKLNIFLDETNINEIFKYKIDYVIDACDTVNTKILLIKECLDRNIKFISSMGTANKIDPKNLKIMNLNQTSYDPLAKKIREKIKKENINGKIMVLSSCEECKKLNPVGSYSVVTNTAGILLADYIIKDIIK